ncbi:hypothetical protein NKG94_51975 [Micromonospora sp. M12]
MTAATAVTAVVTGGAAVPMATAGVQPTLTATTETVRTLAECPELPSLPTARCGQITVPATAPTPQRARSTSGSRWCRTPTRRSRDWARSCRTGRPRLVHHRPGRAIVRRGRRAPARSS